MSKARQVKGVKRNQRLDDAIARIIAVRLDELCAFMPRAGDPAEVEALHNMRIAAKRLRYLLELSDFCFGPYAAKAGKRTKQLQDLIGEIHDCDVTLPRIEALQAQADPEDPAAHGLTTVAARLRGRRAGLHEQFLALWLKLEREGFRPRLEYAIGERPEPPRNDESFTPAEIASDAQR